MKKKLLACILIIVLVLSGCGGQKPNASLENTGTSQPEPSNPTTDPTATGEGQAVEATTPTAATEEPPKPTEAPKPTETRPKPTETPKPTEAHQHNYKAQTVAATCTSQGYTVDVCSCGAKTEAHDYTPALGHDYQATQTVEATPWSAGYTESVCSRCNSSNRTETGTLSGDQLEAFRYEVAKAAVKYINEYRVQEGSTELTYLPGLSQVVMFRSEQLITNFNHSSEDDQIALAKFQYGTPYTIENSYFDPDIGKTVYTGEMITLWKLDGACRDAIGKVNLKSTADAIGKRIADNIHGSPSHWQYIKEAKYSFAGVGWCIEGYWAFWVCEKNND